jgi:hypothetical protein
VVIEGAATQLLPQLAKEGAPFAPLYEELREKNLLSCVCKACCQKMGTLAEAERQGLKIIGDMQGHPSIEGFLREALRSCLFSRAAVRGCSTVSSPEQWIARHEQPSSPTSASGPFRSNFVSVDVQQYRLLKRQQAEHGGTILLHHIFSSEKCISSEKWLLLVVLKVLYNFLVPGGQDDKTENIST